MKPRLGEDIFDISVYIFMIVVAFATLYPFFYCVVLSFNNGWDSQKGGVFFWPRAFTTLNYKIVLGDERIGTSFLITVLRTLVGAFTHVFFTAFVAYGLSREDLKYTIF